MSRSLPAGLRRVLRRELRQIRFRPKLAFMLLPFPVLLMGLLAVVFSPGLPTDLPVAVVDRDNTTLSRQAVRMVDATPDLRVALQVPDLAQGREALFAGDVYAVVLIPENMERDLLAGRQPELVTLYNNQLLTIGGIVSRATRSAFATFGSGAAAAALVANGNLPEAARVAIQPIPVQQSPLFNPALDYVHFLLASLMPTVLQIFITSAAALVVARDAQHVNGLVRLRALGGSPLPALVGKLLPYACAYLLTLLIADAIMFGVFGSPFNGSLVLHLVYSVLFVLASLSLGTVLAIVAGDTIGALGMTAVMTGPAFGFAGISFPRITMNGFAWAWGGMIPLTPYLQLRTDQALRGTPVELSLPDVGWLAGLVVLYGTLALLLFARSSARTSQEVPQ